MFTIMLFYLFMYHCILICSKGVLGGKPSNWIPLRPKEQVPVYLRSEQQQDRLTSHLQSLLTRTFQLSVCDEMEIISRVLLPEVDMFV